jgi:hypothetical protein
MIDVLNVATVAGLPLACIGFLWSNRLIPLHMPERHDVEIAAFFGVWLAALLHAACRPATRAWREQLWTAAALCLLLPALNAATTGQHLPGYLAQGEIERAGVELTAIGLGALLAVAARRSTCHKAKGTAIIGKAATQ